MYHTTSQHEHTRQELYDHDTNTHLGYHRSSTSVDYNTSYNTSYSANSSDGLSGQSQEEDNSDGEEYGSTSNPESTTNQH